jgi:transposase|tara:strand:- start:1293 stop:1706 length:414 start_codon:yes stop_codon:yes gene_type:complete
MRFEEVYGICGKRKITQEAAGRMLGVSDRTFRRYIDRYEEDGLVGLLDKRLSQASSRRAPVDEIIALTGQYESRYMGWKVKHFYSWYSRDGGSRSYSWVKKRASVCRFSAEGAKERVASQAVGTVPPAGNDASSGWQ